MLGLYHNCLSTCSQKVQLALSFKNLNWQSHSIDLLSGENLSSEYLTINPKGQVPVLVHNDRKIAESSIINEYLDDAFPTPSLRPEVPFDRAQVRLWTRRIDDVVHAAIGVITFASVFRTAQLQRPREDVIDTINRVPNAASRRLRHSIFENGIDAPEFPPALDAVKALLEDLVQELDDREWLVGTQFSLAEAAIMPYVLRLQHLKMDFLWGSSRFAPFQDWVERVQKHPAFVDGVAKLIPASALQMFEHGAKALKKLS